MENKKLTLQEMKAEYRNNIDTGDIWGSNINIMFDICEYDSVYGNGDIMALLDYHPGAGRLDGDEIEYKWLFKLTTPDVLKEFAEYLNEIDRVCRIYGMNY